ncbi:hypothetical protein COSO111634_35505 [Corallococcus soli]
MAVASWTTERSGWESRFAAPSRPYSESSQSMRSMVRISRLAMVSRRLSRSERPVFRASVCTAIFTDDSGLRISWLSDDDSREICTGGAPSSTAPRSRTPAEASSPSRPSTSRR